MQRISLVLLPLLAVCVAGCSAGRQPASETTGSGRKVAVISITSDAQQDPQKVNMGLIFAKFCAEEDYEVAIFFNVKGVHLPTRAFDDDFKYLQHDPLKTQIRELVKQGVEIHVCPVCMGELNVTEGDIMDGAFVTTKPKLFSKLGSDTMVFTY